jgi:hypothetical protein
MVEQGAAPAGGDKRSHRARAVPGLRSGTLRPPARSWLTVRSPWLCPMPGMARCPKGSRLRVLREGQQPPKARPGCRKTPPWRAERRGHSGNGMLTHEKLERRLARHTLDVSGEGKGKAACPGPQTIRVMMLACFSLPSPLRGGSTAKRSGWG